MSRIITAGGTSGYPVVVVVVLATERLFVVMERASKVRDGMAQLVQLPRLLRTSVPA